MGRMYAAPIDISSFGTAAGDIVEIRPAAGKPIAFHGMFLADSSANANERLAIIVKRMATSGSGGTTVTGVPLDPNGAADACTVETANTTDASSTATNLKRDAFDTQQGWQYLPAPEHRILQDDGESLVVAITDTPATSPAFQGYILYEELI